MTSTEMFTVHQLIRKLLTTGEYWMDKGRISSFLLTGEELQLLRTWLAAKEPTPGLFVPGQRLAVLKRDGMDEAARWRYARIGSACVKNEEEIVIFMDADAKSGEIVTLKLDVPRR